MGQFGQQQQPMYAAGPYQGQYVMQQPQFMPQAQYYGAQPSQAAQQPQQVQPGRPYANQNPVMMPQQMQAAPVQMAPQAQVRQSQIQQICRFYQSTAVIQRTQDKEEFRIPLQLSHSTAPLFVKVGMPYGFPMQAPTINVMHAVVHDKIEPQTYKYIGDSLNNWGGHSNLLSVIRQMHQEFQAKAPIPVGHDDLRKSNQN